MLWVNDEPSNRTIVEDSRSPHHEYQIGAPISDSHANTIRLFYMAMVFAALPKEQHKMLFDPLREQRNAGLHIALIIVNIRHGIPVREEGSSNDFQARSYSFW
jgi:hypothetical protein